MVKPKLNKKQTKMKTILVSISLLISVAAFCQNNAEQTKINDYLESTIQNKNTLLISSTSQKVVASDLFESATNNVKKG